ncbi:hypothetical protein V4U21_004610 [Vibrio parahaemolyticus]
MSDAKKFGQHFPVESDFVLQVLKGHLLLEESNREFLVALASHPSALKGDSGAPFDCHQAICITQAFYPQSNHINWVWSAAKRLNKMRNNLAHNLEPRGDIKATMMSFNSFVSEHASQQIEEAKASPLSDLKNPDFMFSVMAVCSTLAIRKAMFRENIT